MNEIWKQINDFPYEVSSLGRVRRYGKKPLKLRVHSSGYLRVYLGAKKEAYVHRLVCEAFNGPPPTKDSHADHINKNRKDNRLLNLRWLSPTENRATRVFPFGEKHYQCKISEEKLFDILWRTGCGESDSLIAKEFNLSTRYIYDIRNRKERNRLTNHD